MDCAVRKVSVEFYVDDDLVYRKETNYTEDLEKLYDIPKRFGFEGKWVLESENDVYKYSAEYSIIEEYADNIYWAKYKVCGMLRYLVPFTIKSGLILDLSIDPRLEGIVGWKYIPLEARDCEITLTSDPDEILKARKRSAGGCWEKKSDSQIIYCANKASLDPLSPWKIGRGNAICGYYKIHFGNVEKTLDSLGQNSRFFDIAHNNPLYTGDFEKYVDNLQKQYNDFKNICEPSEYRVVFLGEPGKGKTTTICNWLNLLKKDKRELDSIADAPLLETKSGRTSAFEVHISSTDSASCVELELLNKSDQLEKIRAFSNIYWMSCNGSEKSKADVHLSEEIKRMIKNMAGLKDPSISSEKEDAISFINNFENSDKFYDWLVKTIDLDHRKTTRFEYDSSEEFEAWLSQLFKDINKGNSKSVSIPKTLSIFINKNDFSLQLPDRCKEVIDTVGLDDFYTSESAKQLLTAKDTLIVFIEGLGPVPSEKICNIFSEVFSGKNEMYA